MGMVDQVIRTVAAEPLPGKLGEIERILDRARDGVLSENAALEAVAEVVEAAQRGSTATTYQKPLG